MIQTCSLAAPLVEIRHWRNVERDARALCSRERLGRACQNHCSAAATITASINTITRFLCDAFLIIVNSFLNFNF